MNYKQQFIHNNRPFTKLKPLGIIIHDTANPGATAQEHFVYWDKIYRGSSAHAVVDWDEVIQLRSLERCLYLNIY